MKLTYAKLVGTYKGRKYYRFQVRLTQSGLDRDFWITQALVPVVAESAAAACNLVRDEIAPLVNHPTEIECLGPQGGLTSRFIGYDSLIWAKMCRIDCAQLTFVFS